MEDFIKRTVTASILLAIGLLATFLVVKYTTPKVQPNPGTSITPLEYPDYEGLNRLIPIVIVSDTPSSKSSKGGAIITRYIYANGEFSKMYLYAKVSVNEKPLTDWDSLYVKFNGKIPTLGVSASGGHLFRPKTLRVPGGDTFTELLFNTSVVPYVELPYSSSKEPKFVDWFNDVFAITDKIRIDAFISTTGKGLIDSIKLYYECAEETPDCYMEVE